MTLISKPKNVLNEETEAITKKYEKVLKDVKEKLCDEEVVARILNEIPKDLDTSRESYVQNRKKRIDMLLGIAGLKTEEDRYLYQEALQHSSKGYSIIYERDLDEIWVNSYNPEWARAWNGNTVL